MRGIFSACRSSTYEEKKCRVKEGRKIFKGSQTYHLLARTKPTGAGQGKTDTRRLVEGILKVLGQCLFPGSVLQHGNVLQAALWTRLRWKNHDQQHNKARRVPKVEEEEATLVKRDRGEICEAFHLPGALASCFYYYDHYVIVWRAYDITSFRLSRIYTHVPPPPSADPSHTGTRLKT